MAIMIELIKLLVKLVSILFSVFAKDQKSDEKESAHKEIQKRPDISTQYENDILDRAYRSKWEKDEQTPLAGSEPKPDSKAIETSNKKAEETCQYVSDTRSDFTNSGLGQLFTSDGFRRD